MRTNKKVKDLQRKLNKVLNLKLRVDGDYGNVTKNAVKRFQSVFGLVSDGDAGQKTLKKLDTVCAAMVSQKSLLNFGKRRFVVFVDAGHGGISEDNEYVTKGKRGYHPSKELHRGGHYYEGLENRIVAENFIEACTNVGIMCIRTYHPYKDTNLSERTELIRSWLRRGYYGYMHSFHSNAISADNSASKLESTQGFCVYTTRDKTFSDLIAQQHFDNVKETIGKDNWTFREQKYRDGDSDFEANFQMLRQTDLSEFDWFGSILDEWGFHTSATDCEFITEPKNRDLRVEACLKTARWVKTELNRTKPYVGR